MATTTHMGHALMAGVATEFIPTHRQDNDTRVVMNLGLVVPVSVEDLVAVLWAATKGEGRDDVAAALADTAYIRGAMAEMLFGIGGDGMEAARIELDAAKPGSWDTERAEMIRPIVAELVAAHAAARRTRTARQVPHPRTSDEVTQ
ncbi:hypothetical protein [Amycolatopsis sp. DSM 110486]|uniref:hypothetical protein n=1 Tax=Amycolatopsis sp. DSM 110486 TaxID=2865832 RepID=UPI001C69B0BD|nr:hypothetical protein [Amycolatopsis sp. DSM 110486]QYN16844.1 hypothetical protein K1T34_28780 [Amycolatopsis sp. DSM 110486]